MLSGISKICQVKKQVIRVAAPRTRITWRSFLRLKEPFACGTCPIALVWLPVIADFWVISFTYISS